MTISSLELSHGSLVTSCQNAFPQIADFYLMIRSGKSPSPNLFHITMMEATVLFRTFSVAEFSILSLSAGALVKVETQENWNSPELKFSY